MTEHAPLIIDIAGTELTATDRRRLAHPLVGGIILFARNWVDRAQLLQLTSSIKAVRAAFSHRWLHPPAAHARAGRDVDG